MAYYVYMLGCYKNGKGFTNFYTGQTNNLYARVGEHINNVQSRNTGSYTGRFDYVKLVWSKNCNSRSEAMSEEIRIKNMSHSQKCSLAGR